MAATSPEKSQSLVELKTGGGKVRRVLGHHRPQESSCTEPVVDLPSGVQGPIDQHNVLSDGCSLVNHV